MIKLGVYYQAIEKISVQSFRDSLSDILLSIVELEQEYIGYTVKLEKIFIKEYLKNDTKFYYEEITIKSDLEKDTGDLIHYIKESYSNSEAKDLRIIRISKIGIIYAVISFVF